MYSHPLTTNAQRQIAKQTLSHYAGEVNRFLLDSPNPSQARRIAADKITFEDTADFMPKNSERTMTPTTRKLYRMAIAYYHGYGGPPNNSKAGWMIWQAIARCADRAEIPRSCKQELHRILATIADRLAYRECDEVHAVIFDLQNASHGYRFPITREAVDPNELASALAALPIAEGNNV